jgi:hypothetical protein
MHTVGAVSASMTEKSSFLVLSRSPATPAFCGVRVQLIVDDDYRKLLKVVHAAMLLKDYSQDVLFVCCDPGDGEPSPRISPGQGLLRSLPGTFSGDRRYNRHLREAEVRQVFRLDDIYIRKLPSTTDDRRGLKSTKGLSGIRYPLSLLSQSRISARGGEGKEKRKRQLL